MASSMILSALMLLNVFYSISASHAYEAFRQIHGGATLGEGALSYEARRDLFEQRKAEALAHNALNKSWGMVVNKFSDHTDAELRALLGHRRELGRYATSASSFIEINEHGVQENEIDTSKLATEVDWRSQMSSTSWVRNQGACGSCWAVAAVGALETHMEKVHGEAIKLSHQQLVDCVINTKHCGGNGGCEGATVELGFELTTRIGISSDEAYKSAPGNKCNTNAPSSLAVANFVRLPVNKGSHLLDAIANHGPVAVSVDGNDFFSYGAPEGHFGVFSGCKQDATVNHAVLATGYGFDTVDKKMYWTIRNSWGPDWGDKGFMQIERHAGDSEHCGTDPKPKAGVFCDDAPKTAPVCGMCGITSDSAYANPVMTPTKTSRKSLRASNKLVLTNKFGALADLDPDGVQ